MSLRSPQEIHAKFAEAFSSGDLEGLVALYEPDAVLAPEPGKTVTGHAAIREAFKPYLALRPHMKLDTVSVFETADVALMHGRWVIKGTAPDGSQVNMNGCNTEVAHRQPDGGWLFRIDNPFTPA